MKYPILSLAGVLIRSALARDCILPEPTTTIYSHEGLGVLQECTSITGNLVVDPSFTTHFVLENLTILNGSITVADIYYTMVAIRLPNLVSAGALILHEIIDVELPRLDHIGDLLLDSFLPNNLDLGALTDANNIWIYGGWASVNLNNLTTVHKELAFKFAKTRHTLGRMPPWLVVDLPALKTTAQFTVEGRIWRVSAPELEVAGDMGMHDLNYTTGIRFNINNPIELEFPKLHSIGRQTQVFGMVSRISLPALGETDSGLHFNTDSALEIYSTIQTARWVWLWGQIKSVEFPNMVGLGDVSFAEAIKPCNETLVKIWESIPIRSRPGNTDWDWRCYSSNLSAQVDDEGDGGKEKTVSPAHDQLGSRGKTEDEQAVLTG